MYCFKEHDGECYSVSKNTTPETEIENGKQRRQRRYVRDGYVIELTTI